LAPTLSASLAWNRQKQGGQSANSAGVNNSATSTSSSITNNYTWLLSAGWEPDIWGAVRRNIEANVANAEASAALFAATRLSQQATLAQLYFQLRGLDVAQGLLDRTVHDYKQSLQLTLNRYRAGVVSYADVIQAKSQLETAQATMINNHVLRTQYEHAIAVLIGLPLLHLL